jgi:hypothetical protein
MADKFCRIHDLPGLEGLVVKGTQVAIDLAYEHVGTGPLLFVEVKELINPNVVVGDRQVKFPMPNQSLLISYEYLVDITDPFKEYAVKNPFGSLLFNGRYEKDKLEIVYTRYTNGVSITILESRKMKDKKTLYSQNFFSKAAEAIGKIEDVLSGDTDPEDLIMILKDLKEEDK